MKCKNNVNLVWLSDVRTEYRGAESRNNKYFNNILSGSRPIELDPTASNQFFGNLTYVFELK